MKKSAIIFIFLTAFAVVPVFADRVPMPKFTMPTAASNGFGGAHTAYTDNVFSLLVNPAATVRVQQRSFFTLAPSLISPQTTFSLLGSVMDLAGSADSDGMAKALGNMADTLSSEDGKITLGFEFREFPLSIAWVANGFGFGIWNRTFVDASLVGKHIQARIFSDVIIPVGFGFRILEMGGHSIDAGVTAKMFARVMVQGREDILNLLDDSSENFIDTMTLPLIMGGGLDLGIMYRWNTGLRAGLTLTDIFTNGTVVANFMDNKDTNSYYVPFAVNLGLAYEIKPLPFLGLAVAFDWRDMGNIFNQSDYLNSRNASLDFGMGVEVALFNTFYVRMGMNEMLPAMGIGFSFGALKIDLAYYGKEFGNEPGELSAAIVDLSISIRPQAKKRDWIWARRSIFGGNN